MDSNSPLTNGIHNVWFPFQEGVQRRHLNKLLSYAFQNAYYSMSDSSKHPRNDIY